MEKYAHICQLFNQGQIYDWNQLWQAQIPGFTVTRPGSNPNEDLDARPFDYFKISVGHGVTGSEVTQSGLYQRLFNKSNFYKFYYNGQFVPTYFNSQNPNDPWAGNAPRKIR